MRVRTETKMLAIHTAQRNGAIFHTTRNVQTEAVTLPSARSFGQVETEETESGNGKLERKAETESWNGKLERKAETETGNGRQ